MEKNTHIYVAMITSGSYDDYTENTIFCSMNKDKVEKWVNRFNNIITNNEKRIKEYECCENEPPFWYDFVSWDYPIAVMNKIPIR